MASVNEADRLPLDLARLATLQAFLDAASRLTADYTHLDPSWAGLTRSKAAGEAADPKASPALLHELDGAYAFAQVRLQAVLEHGESIGILSSVVGGPAGSLAIDVVARSALETAARAWWVLEDGLSAEGRAARALAIEVHSAHHLDRLAKAMKLAPKQPQIAATQMDAVKIRCKNAGFRISMESTERPRVGNERLPSPTDLILALVENTFFAHEGKGVYELQSAVAHGASYALLRSYEIATGQQPVDRPLVSRRTVDHRIVEGAIAMLLFAYVELMKRLVVLMGWDHTALTKFDSELQVFLHRGPLVIS